MKNQCNYSYKPSNFATKLQHTIAKSAKINNHPMNQCRTDTTISQVCSCDLVETSFVGGVTTLQLLWNFIASAPVQLQSLKRSSRKHKEATEQHYGTWPANSAVQC